MAAVYTSSLILVIVAVGIFNNVAFTSSRLLEGTSLGLGNQPRRFQIPILFIIFHLRSAALSLSLHALVTGGPWYPISGGGSDDMSP